MSYFLFDKSWLACDASGAVYQVNRSDAIGLEPWRPWYGFP